MPSRIEELIAEFRKPHFDCKEDNHEHDCNCGAYLSCADELERAYREEVVPIVNALRAAKAELHYAHPVVREIVDEALRRFNAPAGTEPKQ